MNDELNKEPFKERIFPVVFGLFLVVLATTCILLYGIYVGFPIP